MEKGIADEPKDCSLREGNELFDMPPIYYFTSFTVFECFLSTECNFASSGETVLGVKNSIGVHETCCDMSRVEVWVDDARPLSFYCFFFFKFILAFVKKIIGENKADSTNKNVKAAFLWIDSQSFSA